jgi:hypothetical protein
VRVEAQVEAQAELRIEPPAEPRAEGGAKREAKGEAKGAAYRPFISIQYQYKAVLELILKPNLVLKAYRISNPNYLYIKSWLGDVVIVKLRTTLGLGRASEYSCPLTSALTTIVNFAILGLA